MTAAADFSLQICNFPFDLIPLFCSSTQFGISSVPGSFGHIDVPAGIRTPGHLLAKEGFYQAELRAHSRRSIGVDGFEPPSRRLIRAVPYRTWPHASMNSFNYRLEPVCDVLAGIRTPGHLLAKERFYQAELRAPNGWSVKITTRNGHCQI